MSTTALATGKCSECMQAIVSVFDIRRDEALSGVDKLVETRRSARLS